MPALCSELLEPLVSTRSLVWLSVLLLLVPLCVCRSLSSIAAVVCSLSRLSVPPSPPTTLRSCCWSSPFAARLRFSRRCRCFHSPSPIPCSRRVNGSATLRSRAAW